MGRIKTAIPLDIGKIFSSGMRKMFFDDLSNLSAYLDHLLAE